ncbi:MAG: hypothetical protein GXP49_01840 [Deltaproteobacteria bacterium]|nr:hypothetical protein [Deltaproteobacteria bacterium]
MPKKYYCSSTLAIAAFFTALAPLPSYATHGQYVKEGAALRLYQNGLDLLTQLAPDFVDPNPITGVYPGQELGSASCLLDTLHYGIKDVNYTIPIDERSLVLDFMNGNKIGGEIVLEATVTTNAYSHGCAINKTIPIYAHGLTGHIVVTVGVVDHAIQVLSVDEFEIDDIWDLEVDGGWIESLVEIFGYDVEAEIEKAIKEKGKDALKDELPSMLNEMLKKYVTLSLNYNGLDFRIQPERFPIDDMGGSLFANSGADAQTRDACVDQSAVEPGFDAPASGGPAKDHEGAFAAVAASKGFMDDLLWGVWEMGMLCYEDTVDLGALIPDQQSQGQAHITVVPGKPPTLDLPPPGTMEPTIHIKDLNAVVDMIMDGKPSGTITVSADADLKAKIDITDENSLVLIVTDIQLFRATIGYDSGTVDLSKDDLDKIVNDVLMPMYQDQIGALPLIDTVLSFSGVYARILDIERSGDYIVVYLALAKPSADDKTPPTTYIDRVGGINPAAQHGDLIFGMSGLHLLYHATDDLPQYDAFITYQWHLDSSAWVDAVYKKSTVLDGMSDGKHTFTVRARDFSGNLDPTGASVEFDVDGVPPETTIEKPPPEFTSENMVEVSYSGSDDRGGDLLFQARLDDGDWSPYYIAKNMILSVSAEGAHKLQVRAIDSVGNPDPSPAEADFVADYTAPETGFSSTPGAWGSPNNLVFDMSADDALCPKDKIEYRHRLVKLGGMPGPCDGEWTEYSKDEEVDMRSCELEEGEWIFLAQARDAAGNEDLTPAEARFTMDLTPPDTEITKDPGSEVTGARASFTFSGSDNFTSTADLRFSWRAYLLGRGDQVEWSEPKKGGQTVVTGLTPGKWVFEVESVDLADNVDPTPESRQFDVYASSDKNAPSVEFTKSPGEIWNKDTAAFEWKADDDVSPDDKILCSYRLLPDQWSEPKFTRSATVQGLEDGGSYRFEVRCEDEAGNQGTAFTTFDVDFQAELPNQEGELQDADTGQVEADANPVADSPRREWGNGLGGNGGGCGCSSGRTGEPVNSTVAMLFLIGLLGVLRSKGRHD